MKVCPKCGTASTDDAQSFCLMDGTPLVDQTASEPTIVMTHSQRTVTAPQLRKKKTGLWVVLSLVGLVVIGGLIGLLMFAAYRMGSESAAVKGNATGNNTSSTSRSTPKPTATTATTTQTPESSDDIPSPDEPTPIVWNTSGGTFKNDVGLKYTFECPPDGTAGAVWGSDVYTSDSSICTAAVHAGKITLDKGGIVTIEFIGGRATYGAKTRNGITSYNFGQFPRSFVFRDAAKSD